MISSIRNGVFQPFHCGDDPTAVRLSILGDSAHILASQWTLATASTTTTTTTLLVKSLGFKQHERMYTLGTHLVSYPLPLQHRER